MKHCVRCSSCAINHHSHGRDGSDADLCDVCYWRKRAESAAQPASDNGAIPERHWPPVTGVGRDAGHPRAVMVYLGAEPTDCELRMIHAALAVEAPTSVPGVSVAGEERCDCGALCQDNVENCRYVTQVSHTQPAVTSAAPAGKYDEVLVPFMSLMERELHANADKGDRPGWLAMTFDQLMLEIYYHAAKLQKALRDDASYNVGEHAADVANLSMMVADRYGLLALQSAILPAAPVPVAGKGWKLVPVEPTEAMGRAYLEAARVATADGAEDTMRFSYGGYKGLLAAAPTPVVVAPTDEADWVAMQRHAFLHHPDNGMMNTRTKGGTGEFAISGTQSAWVAWLSEARAALTAAIPASVPSAPAAGERRIAELEDILRTVAQQFRRHGNNFPDGFDGRVFRWVEDALAATLAPGGPLTEAPPAGTKYWAIAANCPDTVEFFWDGGATDQSRLRQGYCFRTKADALAALQAIKKSGAA